MLKGLRQHPLVVGATEVVADGARYIAALLILMILLWQLATLVGAGT